MVAYTGKLFYITPYYCPEDRAQLDLVNMADIPCIKKFIVDENRHVSLDNRCGGLCVYIFSNLSVDAVFRSIQESNIYSYKFGNYFLGNIYFSKNHY